MSTDYRPGAGNQRHKRRRSGPGAHRPRSSEGTSDYSNRQPKKKEGFLSRLIASIFGGGSKKKSEETSQPEGDRAPNFRTRNGGRERNERNDRGDRGDRRNSQREESGATATTEGDSQNPAPETRRENTPLEVTTPRLYVGNLSYEVSESDLFDLFTSAGKVRNIEIARDRSTERSKGFGFAEMETLEDAKGAQTKLNGYELQGRPLVISGAKAQSPRGGRRDS